MFYPETEMSFLVPRVNVLCTGCVGFFQLLQFDILLFSWLFRDCLTISMIAKTCPHAVANSKSTHTFSMYTLRSPYRKGSE